MWQSTSKGLFSIVDRAYLYSEATISSGCFFTTFLI